jgi:hypothetical protein
VAVFLNMNLGHPYCRLCLERVLRADRYKITKALAILRITEAYCVEPGMCAGCHMPRITIRLNGHG